jgi:hypothetical protein
MRITCVWAEEDIKVGQFFYMNPSQVKVSEDPGYFLSTLHKIGYMPERGDDQDARYVSIAMNDGQVITEGTKKQFAENLTNSGYIPCTGKALTEILARCAATYGENGK